MAFFEELKKEFYTDKYREKSQREKEQWLIRAMVYLENYIEDRGYGEKLDRLVDFKIEHKVDDETYVMILWYIQNLILAGKNKEDIQITFEICMANLLQDKHERLR